MEEIKIVNIAELRNFSTHPYIVELNHELIELAQSIKREGILVPLLVRKNPYGEGYEIIAGHRRKEAAIYSGLSTVPVVIREMDDDQAIITMVDSNLQRENLKPSEKAFAYKMKVEALNHRGKKIDSSLCQLGTNKYQELNTHKLGIEIDEKGCRLVDENTDVLVNLNTGDVVGRQVQESRRQVFRYIRLTYLIPKLLKMIDDGVIAFSIGVELSYLSEEEQYELYAVMDLEQCTPSLSQANRLKRKSKAGELDMDMMYLILEEEKPNQREQIKIRAEVLNRYFPKDFTPKQKVLLIEQLVKEWYENKGDMKQDKKKSTREVKTPVK